MNQTYEIPEMLSNLQGANDTAHWETVVVELKPDSGVILRGTVLSAGPDGKLLATTAGNEAQAFGVLLDPSIDTAAKFTDGTVTGSVARAGSFKGQALIVGVGTNVTTLGDALRKNGIYLRQRHRHHRSKRQHQNRQGEAERPLCWSRVFLSRRRGDRGERDSGNDSQQICRDGERQ